MLKVFIGYDERQPVAFNVLAHSVASRASKPVAIVRLQLNQLPMKRRGLTCFTYSRFLVPYLSNFEGVSIFLDADMLCLGDIWELEKIVCTTQGHCPAVWVVKNARRFEWPSLMVFNNAACRTLTPDFVDNPANNLYDLAWAGGDNMVGALPSEWNHLEGYDAVPPTRPKLVHFTMGIPCWPETAKSHHADLWREEFRAMNSTVKFEQLMGKSVHAQHIGKLQAA